MVRNAQIMILAQAAISFYLLSLTSAVTVLAWALLTLQEGRARSQPGIDLKEFWPKGGVR
jgi:hypothetical protein